MSFARPTEPAAFRAMVQSAAFLATEDGPFPDLWGAYKGYFAAAQHGKCAYCESRVVGVADGDVEHYAPKAEVHTLDSDPSHWGNEVQYLSNVVGRKTHRLGKGYWWRAYDWTNYLFTCSVCNSKWKRNLFPVEEPRTIPPAPGIPERALLLNPFDDPDTSAHFRFTDFGSIEPSPLDDAASETIKTCGLDRPSLTFARREIARDAHRHVGRFLQAFLDGEDDRRREAASDLLALGEDQRVHCGMVRAIVRDQLGVSWADLPGFA